MKSAFSGIGHPQSNPIERTVRELGRNFRAYCAEKHKSWLKYTSQIQDFMNITTHECTGFTPHELNFGEKANNKIRELIKHPGVQPMCRDIQIRKAKENMIKAEEQRSKRKTKPSNVTLNVCDQVLLRIPRQYSAQDGEIDQFFHIFYGQFKVHKIINDNAAQLTDPLHNDKIKGTFNRRDLRKYISRSFPFRWNSCMHMVWMLTKNNSVLISGFLLNFIAHKSRGGFATTRYSAFSTSKSRETTVSHR